MLACHECGSRFAPHQMAIVDGAVVSPCEDCNTLLPIPVRQILPRLAPPRRGPPSASRVLVPAA